MATVISHDKSPRQSKSHLWLGLLFFLFCYVYLWLFVDPRLIYDGFGAIVLNVPAFATGWQSLRDSLGLPGGLTTYAYGLLSQSLYYPWLGSFVIVLVSLCLYGLARWHFSHAGRRSVVLPYVPAIMIVLLYSRYDHPLAACLALAVGLAFSLVLEKAHLRKVYWHVAAFCVTSGVCYWLAGAGATFILALMTAVDLLALHQKRWVALLPLPIAVVIVWILADRVFLMSPERASVALTPMSGEWTDGVSLLSRVLILLLYAFVPVHGLFIRLWARVAARKAHAAATVHSKVHAAHRARDVTLKPFRRFVRPAVPMAILLVGLSLFYDRTRRQIVAMNSLSRQQRWSDVLELGRRVPKHVYNIYCNHDINRALFEAGRLGYDLFRFPQNPHALLLTHEQDESCMTQVKMCDAFIELGNVDLAQKLACEFVVDKGHLGMVMEKLAWINIIKGQPDTARTYLNALKKDLVYCGQAEAMLRGLDNGFGPDESAYIRRINSYIRRQGDSGRLDKESIEEMLTGLLEQNPGNRMAFEYLMACYLLAGQLDKIEANIGRLQGLGYREIPTLYEEAILISYGARRQRLDLNEIPVNRQTLERYKRFVKLSDSMRPDNRETAYPQLLQEFGTSYFFYYRFTVLSQG